MLLGNYSVLHFNEGTQSPQSMRERRIVRRGGGEGEKAKSGCEVHFLSDGG